MKAYLLTPISENLGHRNWAASTCRVPCLVAAASEDEAVDAAVSAFLIAVERSPGAQIALPPWRFPELVACETVESEDGTLAPGEIVTVDGELHRDGEMQRTVAWPL